MSAQYPGKKNDSMEDRYPIIIKNESGEEIPALSIAKLKDATGIPINKAQRVTVEKPTGSGQHIFTWPFKIASGKEGRGRLASPMPVNFDGSAPAAGATVGPTSGSWKVSTSGSGYFAVGGAEDGVVLVLNPGGGGSVTSVFGQVLEEATANAGLPGTYIRLNNDLQPVDADGEIVIIDPGDEEYDEELVEAAKVTFYSVHRYAACPVGARIRATTIKGESEEKVFGECVDVLDYLFVQPTFGEKRSLAVQEGGTEAADIKWLGAECEES